MKIKRRKSKQRLLRRAVVGGLSRMRKQSPPANPLQETDGFVHSNNGSNRGAGILRPGTGDLRLPTALAEAGESDPDGSPSWVPGPVVIIITIGALAFIAIIAWFVSQMPAK